MHSIMDNVSATSHFHSITLHSDITSTILHQFLMVFHHAYILTHKITEQNTNYKYDCQS
nr:hypothetical protein Itr_chr07CG09470 [Ipomoea trifida]